MAKTVAMLAIGAAMAVAGAGPAHAAAGDVMKTCGAKYQAAKAGNTLPAGQTWKTFLAACRASMPRSSADASAKTASTTPRTASPAQLAARDRMKQCSAQWKAAKAAGKTGDQRWPAYWSACSARLKGTAG